LRAELEADEASGPLYAESLCTAMVVRLIGVPVHQYVIQRRVERARTLLLQGKLNASQIALDTGLAHQSHMAHWMGRPLGVTPRELTRSGANAGNPIVFDPQDSRIAASQ
jgi:AraC family transcriptional regulator